MIICTFDTQEECDKFIFLYEKYYKIVFYTISIFIKDEFQAEDLLHDIYILIGKKLDCVDMDNPKKCRNFIITVARNYCKSYLRKQKNVNEDLIDDIDTLEDMSNDVLEDIIEKEQLNHLMDKINQLDDKYRMVLELKYTAGFHDDEIAELFGISRKNVQMRLYRAKAMLRKKLEEK